MKRRDAYICVACFGSRLEAETVAHALEPYAIPYLIQGEDVGILGAGQSACAPGGVQLWIPATAVDEARRLLPCALTFAPRSRRTSRWNLRQRAAATAERMDDPDCDREELFRTYRHFETLTPWVGGWAVTYRRYLRPLMRGDRRSWSILDVGAGGGSLLATLAPRLLRDGIRVQWTGIDPDPRAIDYARSRGWPIDAEFRCCFLADLVAERQRFDFTISNHLLHHLEPSGVTSLLQEAGAVTLRRAVFSDLLRSAAAHHLFALGAPLVFRRSFVAEDGRISIRRSYRADELAALAPDGWRIVTQAPFRLLALRDGEALRERAGAQPRADQSFKRRTR